MDRLPETGMTQRDIEGGAWYAHPDDACTPDAARMGGGAGMSDHQRLARTLEAEVIPRLVIAHRVRTAAASSQAITFHPGDDGMDVRAFVRLLLTRDMSHASAHVDALRRSGVTLDALCTDLLAPAARRLGEMWVEDLCEFTDVTLGLWRLQHVLREFAEAAPDQPPKTATGLRVLLVPAPGEQHSFGISVVGEFFRHAGWDVSGGVPATARDMADLARSDWFDVIGLSLASPRFVEPLRSAIAVARRASSNRAITILVGGKAFADDPGLGTRVGADGVVVDGRHAALQAERTLSAKGALTRP